MKFRGLIFLFLLYRSACSKVYDGCRLSKSLVKQIESYAPVIEEIYEAFTAGPFKDRPYKETAKFVDRFGARISGSKNLESAIDYMVQKSLKVYDEVKTEPVEVPSWSRGEEYARLVKPRFKNIHMAGLGHSIGTPPQGITAKVIVVSAFEELENLPNEHVEGKIVVYNEPFENYTSTVMYRVMGASSAAKKGAVAALVRSVADFDIGLPHTGVQFYDQDVRKIPVAAITWADADQLKRIQDRNEELVITMKMTAEETKAVSRNTIAELKGKTEPKKHVIVSGHIDSWDKGEGAMDDGAGMIISWLAPIVLKRLNRIPKRSIRSILWTCEEFKLVGAKAYQQRHEYEEQNLVFAMELDAGVFNPLGLIYSGSEQGECVIREVVKLFRFMNAAQLDVTHHVGTDISVFTENGIPGVELKSTNYRHYWYHHTDADNMNVLNADELNRSAALWTSLAYVIADMDYVVPRKNVSNVV